MSDLTQVCFNFTALPLQQKIKTKVYEQSYGIATVGSFHSNDVAFAFN